MADGFQSVTALISGQTDVGTKILLTLFRPSDAVRRVEVYKVWVSPRNISTTASPISTFELGFFTSENQDPGGNLITSHNLDNLHDPSVAMVRETPATPVGIREPFSRYVDPPEGVPSERILFHMIPSVYETPITLRSSEDEGLYVSHVVSGATAEAIDVVVGIQWTEE